MAELRRDPVTGRYVVIAESRQARPNDFARVAAVRSDLSCPFCQGREHLTPQETFALRGNSPAGGPGWQVRVVPNKYPALERMAPAPSQSHELLPVGAGIGVHEVIVECPEHAVSAGEVPCEQWARVLQTYQRRLAALGEDSQLAYGLIFKNVGPAAGASIEHAHSQLLATPLVPPVVRDELAAGRAYHERTGNCVFCAMLACEREAGVRMVLDEPNFSVYCPWASRFAFEMCLAPKAHSSRFEDLPPDQVDELAVVLRRTLVALESALDRPAYNYIIHTAPFGSAPLAHYHWHLEIFPRLSVPAGFEWGSGWWINPVSPEAAARALQSCLV